MLEGADRTVGPFEEGQAGIPGARRRSGVI